MKPLWTGEGGQGRNKQKRDILTRGHNWPFRCLNFVHWNMTLWYSKHILSLFEGWKTSHLLEVEYKQFAGTLWSNLLCKKVGGYLIRCTYIVGSIVLIINPIWPRSLQKNVWLLKLFFAKVAFASVGKGPPLWNFGISDEFYFFQWNQITLQDKKCTVLFQTHNWKSQFF